MRFNSRRNSPLDDFFKGVPKTYKVKAQRHLDGQVIETVLTEEELAKAKHMDSIQILSVVEIGATPAFEPPPAASAPPPPAFRPPPAASPPPSPGGPVWLQGRRTQKDMFTQPISALKRPAPGAGAGTGQARSLESQIGEPISIFQGQIISRAIGGLSNCANFKEKFIQCVGRPPKFMRGRLAERTVPGSDILPCFGIKDKAHASHLIQALLDNGFAVMKQGAKREQVIKLVHADMDEDQIRAFMEAARTAKRFGSLNQPARDLSTGEPFTWEGRVISIGELADRIRMVQVQNQLEVFALFQALGFTGLPGDHTIIIGVEGEEAQSNWGSRSLARNNSGYPDTMIPLPYPRKDYEFSRPPIVAHWTSYPQYAYDQFYPDPGRLAWTGTSSSSTQGNPRRRK